MITNPIFWIVATMPICGLAQLTRVPNTTLIMPQTPATEAASFTRENAFGSLTFASPICIRNAPSQSSHLFVVQRKNGIERVDLATNTRSTFMNLAGHLSTTSSPQRRLATSFENGILSFAFHPNYKQNGYFYVFYSTTITSVTNTNAQLYQRVSRFQAIGIPGAYDLAASADPATEVPMISQRDEAENHNGGDMHFGNDGYLYISTGDEGNGDDSFDNARYIDKDFFSAILRIDVDQLPGSLTPKNHVNLPVGAHVASAVHAGTYSIPANNPFNGATTHHGLVINTSKLRTEIWACGFRNPWRMSFDSPTGRLFVADVGQEEREEINIVTAGNDYGWSHREGSQAFNLGPGGSTLPTIFNPVAPIHDYAHTLGYSITGGVISRGARLAELAGKYI
jgi:glucose/arabinose dehydrogenase